MDRKRKGEGDTTETLRPVKRLSATVRAADNFENVHAQKKSKADQSDLVPGQMSELLIVAERAADDARAENAATGNCYSKLLRARLSMIF